VGHKNGATGGGYGRAGRVVNPFFKWRKINFINSSRQLTNRSGESESW